MSASRGVIGKGDDVALRWQEVQGFDGSGLQPVLYSDLDLDYG